MNAHQNDLAGEMAEADTEASVISEAFVPRPRPWWRHAWIIGVAVYVLAAWWIGWEEMKTAIQGVKPWPFAAMVALLFAAQWLRAAKWVYAMGRVRGVLAAHFISKAAGEWSPARLGEFAPLLMKSHRNARMAAWIAVDRLLEMAATLALGLVGLVGLQIESRAAMIGLGLLLLGGVIGCFWVMGHDRFFAQLAARCPAESRRRFVARVIAAISVEVRMTLGLLPVAGALTIVASFLDLAVGYFLWKSFGFDLDFIVLASAKGLHAVVSAIPVTPGATGVPYISTAMLYHEVGGIPEAVLTAGIGLTIGATAFVFWSSFGVAMLSLRRRDEAETARP